jgi:hypothetical protein
VALLAARSLQVRIGCGFEAGGLTETGRVALQAFRIRLKLGRQDFEALSMLGGTPFEELVEVAGRALFDPDILLLARRLRLASFFLSVGLAAPGKHHGDKRNPESPQISFPALHQHGEDS